MVTVDKNTLGQVFSDPPREFGVLPFWFWNDDLEDEELLRQIQEFHAKGFGGFLIHARIGLSRRVGYLTEEYFRLTRLVVEEADRLGMKVILYDEGCYPSGSAQGKVVAENPGYAARCLIPQEHRVTGPAKGYWRPNPGRAMQDRLVCVVQGREIKEDVLDPDSLTLLSPEGPGLVRYEVPEGAWRLVACWNVYSGGTIRGLFDEEDDRHANAPAAGSLMDPEAVGCFIRLTHDAYYEHLKEYFGTTILAMFTDEPNPLGRAPKRGPKPKPFTEDFLEDVERVWEGDVKAWLPALWIDCGPRTEAFRSVYNRAWHDRIEEVFYAGQSRWCEAHGIALTGHPEESNEMGALRHFQWPGQDMVWRYVEPGKSTALEGGHSLAAKAASSAAIVGGRRRNGTEAMGAYGWRLTLDETKWLLDWHLSRGNNLYMLHACFYSIRGRRAFESEPDIGVHNVWWPYFNVIGDYIRRASFLITDGVEVCDVAVLTEPNHMAWNAAKVMTQDQIDFVFVDDVTLGEARIEHGMLVFGEQRFRAVVCDPPDIAGETERAKLKSFRDAGGLVMESYKPEDLCDQIASALGRDLDWPNAPDLRVFHYRKTGQELYLLVNEGEEALESDLSLRSTGSLELWDPMDGSQRPWPARLDEGRTHTHLRLERRQGLVLALDPSGEPDPEVSLPPAAGEVVAEIPGPWKAMDSSGKAIPVPCPGDWAQIREWEIFSGTLRFATEFERPGGSDPLFLDLGRVGNIAEVWLNGDPIGVLPWAPYVLEISEACRPGANDLEVRVTNTMANHYDGLQLPSGLMGPVVLRDARSRKFS